MKRSSPLKRHGGLRRARPRTITPDEAAARKVWKEPHAGWCACGCSRFSLHLERHHVLLAQIVRREGGDEWSLANSMLIASGCHRSHHDAFRRIPFASVPESALAFAVDLLGEGAAAAYFAAQYAGDERRAA